MVEEVFLEELELHDMQVVHQGISCAWSLRHVLTMALVDTVTLVPDLIAYRHVETWRRNGKIQFFSPAKVRWTNNVALICTSPRLISCPLRPCHRRRCAADGTIVRFGEF